MGLDTWNAKMQLNFICGYLRFSQCQLVPTVRASQETVTANPESFHLTRPPGTTYDGMLSKLTSTLVHVS